MHRFDGDGCSQAYTFGVGAMQFAGDVGFFSCFRAYPMWLALCDQRSLSRAAIFSKMEMEVRLRDENAASRQAVVSETVK